jgi:hypothetical protein
MATPTDHTDLKATLDGLRDDPDALIRLVLTQAERINALLALRFRWVHPKSVCHVVSHSYP